MALRYRVGIDTINYMYSYSEVYKFEHISLGDIFKQYEPLNYLIRSIARSINTDFVIYQIIHVVILNVLIGRFIVKHTKYILLALFFYLLLSALYFNTEILRESLAVATFINAYDYVVKKKWIKYYVCAVIAMGFHTSAIIVFVIPFLRNLKLNRLFIAFAVVLMALAIKFQSYFDLVSMYLSADAGMRVDKYINAPDFSVKWMIANLAIPVVIPLFLLFINKTRKYVFKYESMICLYILFGIGIILIPLIFQRFTNYFVFFNIILLTETVLIAKHSVNRIIYLNGICLCCAVAVYITYFRPIDSIIKGESECVNWVPYHSVITKKQDVIREKKSQIQFPK